MTNPKRYTSPWRAYLAIVLIFASHGLQQLFCSQAQVVQVIFVLFCLLMSMIAVSIAQDDGRIRGECHHTTYTNEDGSEIE